MMNLVSHESEGQHDGSVHCRSESSHIQLGGHTARTPAVSALSVAQALFNDTAASVGASIRRYAAAR